MTRLNKSIVRYLRDVTSPPLRPSSLFTQRSFQDRKRAACSRPRQNGTGLYSREVIPLIYKTPKQSFLPLDFPGAIPFKRARSFILGSHAHTGPGEKTNRSHLNINQPAFCSEWLATAQLWPGLVRRERRAGVTCSPLCTMDADQTGNDGKTTHFSDYYCPCYM